MSPSRGYRGASYCLKLGRLRPTQGSIYRHARFFYSIPENRPESYHTNCHFPPSPLTALQTQYPTQCSLKDLLPGSRAQLPKFQLYISTSTNPYINLATEQHIFNSCVNAARAHERAQKDSAKENGVVPAYQHPIILMLYINSPCVVIGRNQNPWVEVNIPRILSSRGEKANSSAVWLLRRRSGGGTVYHDLGNVNYSAIVPATGFTRDQHAEMVVDALKSGGADGKGVRVNERHDVVMAAGGEVGGVGGGVTEVKLSGSAYKLTRTTALHHGTMLIGAELQKVRSFIDSEARAWIKGRGVASVRSPIANVGLKGGVVGFAEEVGTAWKMYNGLKDSEEETGMDVAVCFITEEVALDMPEILEGKNEMHSLAWTFDQTPRFTFSIPITQDLITASSISTVSIPPAPEDLENPNLPTIQVISEKGLITGVELGIQGDSDLGGIDIFGLRESLIGKQFDGGYILDALHRHGVHQNAHILRWIEQVLGRIPGRNS